MDIDVFQKQEQPAVFRALRTALSPHGGPLEARERQFLETYARITGYDLGWADPQPIAARYVFVHGAHPRKRLVQLAALAALVHAPIDPASVAFVKAMAKGLGTHDGVIDVLEALAAGKRFKVRLLAMRRAFRVMLKEAYLAEGIAGVVRFWAAMALKAPVNRDKLWKYKKLGLLPEGTLGREYWKHMTRVGFGFPGDFAGIPDSVAYHDIAHVLVGNDITPLGEIQQGSFQGGNRREDGFFFIQFVILHFHHGVRITPGAPPETGNYHPDKVLWAIHRGAQCNVDVTHQWDYWPLMELPLEEARKKIALLPKLDQQEVMRLAA